jgi:hypothetical protein
MRSKRSVRRKSSRSKRSVRRKSSRSKKKRSSKKSKKKYSSDEKLIIKELNKILPKINFETTKLKFIKEKLEDLNIEIVDHKQFIKDEINNWVMKKISSEISKVLKKKDINTFTFRELIKHLEKKLKMSLKDFRKYIKEDVIKNI